MIITICIWFLSFTWHLCYIAQTNKLCDCSSTTAYKMPRNIPFPDRYIASLPDPVMSSSISSCWFRRPSVRTNIPVAEMPALMQCVPGMVDSKTGSTVHLGLARSSFSCAGWYRLFRQQFWMIFVELKPMQTEWMNHDSIPTKLWFLW